MINTVIIDDEQKARNALSNLLTLHCPEINLIGEAGNVTDGLELIRQKSPDAAFLDVQMPDGTGFDLLEKLGKVNIRIVFVSAYDRFAIQAFKFSALDYLQKPVDADELKEAVRRMSDEDRYQSLDQKLEVLLSNKNSIEKIALPSLDGINFVRLKDIIRCESDNNYTNVYLNDGKKIVVSRTLKDFDEMLSSLSFFRIHKSHLINLSYLQKYRKGDGGSVVMEDGKELEVSRRRKEDFLAALSRV